VVHNEIVVECDQAEVEETKAWLVDCTAKTMQSFLWKVPVEVNANDCADWSGRQE
jgi:DNA polymerase I-like protein with 3'-5' exonuclease and polymerase domains